MRKSVISAMQAMQGCMGCVLWGRCNANAKEGAAAWTPALGSERQSELL